MSPEEIYVIAERSTKVTRYLDTDHQRADYVAILRDDVRRLIAHIRELEMGPRAA